MACTLVVLFCQDIPLYGTSFQVANVSWIGLHKTTKQLQMADFCHTTNIQTLYLATFDLEDHE